MDISKSISDFFTNKVSNGWDKFTGGAGDTVEGGAALARLLKRLELHDTNVMDIAENIRSANDKELDTDIQLITAQYKDSIDYIADTGGFWQQNFWLPVVSFVQEMFGIEETALDKLEMHKDLVDQALNKVQTAIDDHATVQSDVSQRVLDNMITESGQDLHKASDNLLNVKPVADRFTGAANDAQYDGSATDINQPAPTSRNMLEFNYN